MKVIDKLRCPTDYSCRTCLNYDKYHENHYPHIGSCEKEHYLKREEYNSQNPNSCNIKRYDVWYGLKYVCEDYESLT